MRRTTSRSSTYRRHFGHSFYCAMRGVGYVIFTQRNMRIHCIIGLISLFLGLYFKLGTQEWALLLVSVTMVLFAEAINSALEVSVDLVTRKRKFRAMVSKDMAAGAVLITSVNALLVGYLLFFHRFVTLILR